MRKEGMWPKPPALKKRCSRFSSPSASEARQRQARVSLDGAMPRHHSTALVVTHHTLTLLYW
eukprot:scaffold87313_cov57-Phaeocystis_antarctica.AAC.3